MIDAIMRLYRRHFPKPPLKENRVPHMDEDADRKRKIQVLQWNRAELAVRIAKLKKAKKRHSHLSETLEAMTAQQMRLEGKG